MYDNIYTECFRTILRERKRVEKKEQNLKSSLNICQLYLNSANSANHPHEDIPKLCKIMQKRRTKFFSFEASFSRK